VPPAAQGGALAARGAGRGARGAGRGAGRDMRPGRRMRGRYRPCRAGRRRLARGSPHRAGSPPRPRAGPRRARSGRSALADTHHSTCETARAGSRMVVERQRAAWSARGGVRGRRRAHLVVVFQDLGRLVDLLEHFLRMLRVVGVLVGVPLQRLLLISAAAQRLGRGHGHAAPRATPACSHGTEDPRASARRKLTPRFPP
jgi:hypothetical protein